MKKQLIVVILASLCGACATGKPSVRPVVATLPSAPVPPPLNRIEAEEYRAALEEAIDHITARTASGVKIPIVDADAALSMPIPEHKTIEGAVAYFSKDLHKTIQRSLLRSSRYRTQINQVLDEYKLPRALAYLPVIESAYSPSLTSSAGAHGLWQFMPATARDYGLRVDWWVDERANPEVSTRAAARFLRDLYREFGDWSLVLAAYNCGPGRVRRVLRETGSTTFWELLEKNAVPKETRGYVPTFFATILIVSDPEAYGFELMDPEEPSEKVVSMQGPVSLSYLASIAGVESKLLKELNPQYKKGVLPPGKTSIKVPARAAEAVMAQASTAYYQDPDMAVSRFTLRDGDTLETMARLLGVKTEEVSAMNGARRISSGDSIYLPVAQRELSSLLQRNNSPAARFYIVEKGDTLYSIAKRYDLTVEELLDLNRMQSDEPLRPGERLQISLGNTVTAGS